MLPKPQSENTHIRHQVNWSTRTNSQKSMTRNNKKSKFSFSVHLTSLRQAPTYLSSPSAVFPWGLLIPTLNSLGHFVLFFLNTKPGVHRPGILGATSQRLCLRRRAARSPAAYALSGSLPQQTLEACCFVILHTLSSILALLRTAKHAPNMLYPFHKHVLHLVPFPTQSHWAFSSWITSHISVSLFWLPQ